MYDVGQHKHLIINKTSLIEVHLAGLFEYPGSQFRVALNVASKLLADVYGIWKQRLNLCLKVATFTETSQSFRRIICQIRLVYVKIQSLLALQTEYEFAFRQPINHLESTKSCVVVRDRC